MPINLPLEQTTTRKARTRISYQTALTQQRRNMTHVSWGTWVLTIGTCLIWCLTAYIAASATGAHSLSTMLQQIANNAVNLQPQDESAISNTLIAFGAKDNTLILQGQLWRFVTPMFLHLNALHLVINMFNLLILGIYLERLAGAGRLLLIYLVTGIYSAIASFLFAPQEISVGASGAIFGLVGAYSIFILVHRQALRFGGMIDLLWLIIVIGINLGFGFAVPNINTYAHTSIPNVDNSAHIGGFLSGCLLGWAFMPLYRPDESGKLIDRHSLARRWPLALGTLGGTVLLALIAYYLGPKS